jgi:glycosyltransferase involved in cell wall biosynthesis
MKIGIGVTTYNRPETFKKCVKNIWDNTFDNNKAGAILYGQQEWQPKNKEHEIHWYFAKDTDEHRTGVAARKNECLIALKDCDHIFLFDDDCYPIKDGWIDFFINSGEEHLLFLNKAIHNKRIVEIGLYSGDELKYTKELYNDCGGVFMYMTKQAIERVGAFNEKFGLYGFEHAEYSIRILGEHGKYPMLKGTEEYLYAEDYSNPNHKSSIGDEEKQKHIKNNRDKFFKEPIKNIYLPL